MDYDQCPGHYPATPPGRGLPLPLGCDCREAGPLALESGLLSLVFGQELLGRALCSTRTVTAMEGWVASP